MLITSLRVLWCDQSQDGAVSLEQKKDKGKSTSVGFSCPEEWRKVLLRARVVGDLTGQREIGMELWSMCVVPALSYYLVVGKAGG